MKICDSTLFFSNLDLNLLSRIILQNGNILLPPIPDFVLAMLPSERKHIQDHMCPGTCVCATLSLVTDLLG